ncbi:MAG: alpha/beta fold hydrolase [Pseudomonadota bacterium]|nr:alpha/beta fold hydrolase [Pseudomonadota bacterium]
MTELRHPPLAPDHVDAPHQSAALGDLALESGQTIRDFAQSFVTHGELNSDKSNAILICASITGTHHRLDFLIGAGKALDPARWFIVATDAIGNGLSTSPSNSARQPHMAFPRFTLRDMVHAQQRLLAEHLGIERVRAVVGASMGGMQALQWAVSHPRLVERIVAMTPMARTSPWAALVTQTARACLLADPAWNGNGFDVEPERGWRAYAGLMQGLVMRTPWSVEEQLAGIDEAHRWFDDIVARQRATRFDAHDYLYQSWAYEAHDIGTTPGFGDTSAALASISARTLILAPPVDLFNPVSCAVAAAAGITGAHFVEIPSVHGHSAATSHSAADAQFLNRTIAAFLDES